MNCILKDFVGPDQYFTLQEHHRLTDFVFIYTFIKAVWHFGMINKNTYWSDKLIKKRIWFITPHNDTWDVLGALTCSQSV